MNLNHDDIATLANVIAKEVGAVISAQSNSSRWLSLREAMEYAKVKSVNTIKHWINEGYIYGFKRSGEWIIDRESIDDWYESEKY
jgi:hypothetical protein